jgi:hypothetical protein
MPRPGARLRLVLITLAALGCLGALVVARPPLTATAWSRGDDLALAVAWLVAVAASAWLFVATGACAIALGLTRPDLAHRLAPALPSGIRKLVEVAVVGSCIVLPAWPAAAAGPPPAPAVVVIDDQPVVRAPEADAPPTAVPPQVVSARVVVRPGDSLWLIARATLTDASGHRPSEAEVARYWHELIGANRSTLRSGDPSLIFPGEIVALPAPATVS